jgi:hypothetical protein
LAWNVGRIDRLGDRLRSRPDEVEHRLTSTNEHIEMPTEETSQCVALQFSKPPLRNKVYSVLGN